MEHQGIADILRSESEEVGSRVQAACAQKAPTYMACSIAQSSSSDDCPAYSGATGAFVEGAAVKL
jgi:hypothetical protein